MTTTNSPKNNSGTTRLLKEMVKDGLIQMRHFDSVTPDYFFLPTTTSITKPGRRHEHLCGDLYVAFQTLGRDLKWQRPTEYEENIELGLLPDRQMTLDGIRVFWEVDRGTEDYFSEKGISGKVEKYIQLSNLHKDRKFYVIFTTVDFKQTARTRANSILDVFEKYKRADQFLVTLHEWAVTRPLENIYSSSLNPAGISLFNGAI